MRNHIFDLDNTVIDSSHRQRLKPCGDLDLEHWIENGANRELVFRDRLLPFADYWKALDTPPAICTSRLVTNLEYEFLEMHGLRFGKFMHRMEGDMRADPEFKVACIRAHLNLTGWIAAETTLYEDHPGVREAVKRELGVMVFNPTLYNKLGKFRAARLVTA